MKNTSKDATKIYPFLLEELRKESKERDKEYLKEIMKMTLDKKFVIANSYSYSHDDNTLYYKAKGENNIMLFGYEYAKNCSDFLPAALVDLFLRAFLFSEKLNYILFDGGQISVIDSQVYIMEVEPLNEESNNRDFVINNSKVVDANLLSCAKQLINHIKSNNLIEFWEGEDKILNYLYYETLNLLVKGYEKQINDEEKRILERNRKWILSGL